MVDKDAIQLTRHIVGNHVSFPRMVFNGHSEKSIEDLRRIQSEISESFEKELNNQNIKDEGAFEILNSLKKEDWGKKDSYNNFRELYDKYTASSGSEDRKSVV